MHITRPISAIRRARLVAWARLWLLGLAACSAWWDAFDSAIHARLDQFQKAIVALVLLHVAAQWRWRARDGRPSANALKANVTPGGAQRAFIGARLRRALKQAGRKHSIGLRITALLNALRDLPAHYAHTLKRLARGFTRRRALGVVRVDEDCGGALRAAPLCVVDTS